MDQFLAGALFRYLLFPLGSAGLGVAIKCVTRNDRYRAFRKEDIAVGLELMLSACLMFVVLTTDRAIALEQENANLSNCIRSVPVDATRASAIQARVTLLSGQLSMAGWVIALMFIALWSVSTLIRKWGWTSETEMKPLTGIGLPLAVGILFLGAVMAGGLT